MGGGAGRVVILILVVVLASVFLGAYPLYPRISGQFQTQYSNQRFALNSVTEDHLTAFQASSVQKGLIGLSQIYLVQPTGTFDLDMTIYDSNGNPVASGIWTGYQFGLYFFTVVLNAQLTASVTYHLSIVAHFQDGSSQNIQANIPAS